MTVSIAPLTTAFAAQAATLDAALQPGKVVTAQVLAVLDANLVRLAIASLTLDVVTTVPLQAGQTLQLAVTASQDGISLTPVLSEAMITARGNDVVLDDIPLAPKWPTQNVRPVLSPDETRAVIVAAQLAVTRQTGLSPLFANLAAAVTSGQLPQPVLRAAAQLLALRQPGDKAFTGADIKTAMASSGLTMESSLAAASPAAVMPDMKSALSVLRHTLATWLEAGAHSSNPPQGTAVSRTSPRPGSDNPRAASVTAAAADAETNGVSATSKTAGRDLLPHYPLRAVSENDNAISRPVATPPPFRGALPTAQSVASSTFSPDAEAVVVARQLIADTDGARARQTLLQIASLPDRIDVTLPRNETLQPRWHFEIPFVTPQGTAMGQFEIARDGNGNEIDPAQRVWRARFSLDIEPAGPVHALIAFSGETTSVKMWAERPATAAQLRANAFHLGASLDRADLKAGDIVVADGAPTRTQAPSAGHFLNRES